MKKIFIIFLISIIGFLNFQNVYADSFWSEDESIYNYFNLVGSEKRYKWYLEKLSDIGYSNDTNIDLSNTYIDTNDYTISYGDWIQFDGNINDNLEFRKKYTYQTINSLSWIEISKLKMFAYISEIEVLVDNQKIDYDLACGTCDIKNYSLNSLKDGIISNENYFYLTSRTAIFLKLKDNYPLEKIKIIIHFINTNNDNNFSIFFTEKQIDYSNSISKSNIDIPLSTNDNVESVILSIDDTYTFNTKYSDPIETYEEVIPSWHTKVSEIIESREVIKKYHYYNIEREYIDGYYADNPYPELNLKKDEEDYKILYNYQIQNNNNDIPIPDNYLDYLYPNIDTSFDYNSLNNLDMSSLLSNYQNTLNIEDLINQQQNSFNLEDLYNMQNVPNLDLYTNANNDTNEEIIKTDKSKFKNKTIKEENIASEIDFKLIRNIALILSLLILIIVMINKRYRKS